MGSVTRSIQGWWDYFRDLFNIRSFAAEGSILLGPGNQVVEIDTKYPHPDRVYLSIEEPFDEVPTCAGNVNWVAARISNHGFILFANVTSNSCMIRYIVEYDTENNNPNKPWKDKDEKK